MAKLHLHVKRVYFDEIRAKTKDEEFRLTSKWLKRLEGKTFESVLIACGYPRRDDTEKWEERPWKGFTVKTISHEHFGPDPVEVCAIVVN